jgi:4-hydroxy-2-oxoheptanedioate aldolase
MSSAEVSGFRARLRDESLLVGAFVGVPDPAVALVVGRSGFDFVELDAEHGAFTATSLRECLEALRGTPAAAVVRVAANQQMLIAQALDLGADGVQVPHVSTGAQAEAAVRAARFPPAGDRGLGVGRAAAYGLELAELIAGGDARTAVILMIEDREGVENAEAIAAAGADAIFVGPVDLSASLGVPGEPTHPSVLEATDRVLAATKAAGIPSGTLCAPDAVPALAAAGMSFFATFVDTIGLAAAAVENVRVARGA